MNSEYFPTLNNKEHHVPLIVEQNPNIATHTDDESHEDNFLASFDHQPVQLIFNEDDRVKRTNK